MLVPPPAWIAGITTPYSKGTAKAKTSGGREIRLGEIVADEKERLPRETRDGVRQAVAVTQRRRMTSLAEARVRLNRERPVLVSERNDRETGSDGTKLP
jgi:hypothetical protein